MKLFFAYLSGLLFGLGISLSGMANPAKVLNFFDIAGSWDPSLAFVMAGAVAVTFLGYRLTLSRSNPIFATTFSLPTRSDIDIRLVTGSLVFGIGWGIAGFCPGGALPVVGTGNVNVLFFIAASLLGIYLARKLDSVFLTRLVAAQ